MTERIVAFIDGFNLYHAIANLRKPHLKWVNLWELCDTFVKNRTQSLVKVYYFSAYAVWIPDAHRRHKKYVNALVANGVTPVISQFKDKDRRCPKCNHNWIGHEEKETDVNIALALFDGAYSDEFDRAYIVSRDSDLAPAVRMLRRRFPDKGITVIAPPNRGHSSEVLAVQPQPDKAKIKEKHLERCLFAKEVYDAGGNIAARRPQEYTPSYP